MIICTAAIHPESPVVHSADECPACRIWWESRDDARMSQVLDLLDQARALLEGPPIEPATDRAPTVAEEDPGPAGEVRVTIEHDAPDAPDDEPVKPAPPVDTRPLRHRAAKIEAAKIEAAHPSIVERVRASDTRFPSPGQEVTSWRARDETATDYYRALEAATQAVPADDIEIPF